MAHRLNRLLVRENRFNVVVLGEFKRGKSTLLNALLGVDPSRPRRDRPEDAACCGGGNWRSVRRNRLIRWRLDYGLNHLRDALQHFDDGKRDAFVAELARARELNEQARLNLHRPVFERELMLAQFWLLP